MQYIKNLKRIIMIMFLINIPPRCYSSVSEVESLLRRYRVDDEFDVDGFDDADDLSTFSTILFSRDGSFLFFSTELLLLS